MRNGESAASDWMAVGGLIIAAADAPTALTICRLISGTGRQGSAPPQHFSLGRHISNWGRKGKRQQISSLMLRLGRCYPGKKTWGPAHMKWLRSRAGI
jgi:hypothetical protein